MNKEKIQWIAAGLTLILSFVAPFFFVIGVPAAVILAVMALRSMKKRKEHEYYFRKEEAE